MPPTPHVPELLAPAGGPEAAYAALRYGADAVYCGLQRFSARAVAVNFTAEELAGLTAYAHALPRPRRVYVTLNTVVSAAELEAAAAEIATVCEAGADALIVQDAGIARLARRIAPSLELHASTQMAVHGVEGARAAVAQGFSQVTLARELTLEEVRAIARAGVRIECFIHGALCYSYSGLCLMSSHRAGGRSGNRGRCAYPCRERYQLDGGPVEGLAFSMKDLAVGPAVRKLADAGVACLKIEGRMKNALYVAAVTDYYRRILDGTLVREGELRAAEQDLQTIFSRPWTSLYLDGPRRRDVVDPELTGHRGAPIGTVRTETRTPDGSRWLAFRPERPLELHDGLQVDLPGQDRPFGFAVERFGTARPGRPVFQWPAGQPVEVLLPPDAPALPPGATVYCASSQAVKQRFDTSLPPAAERKARTPIEVAVRVEPSRILAEGRTVAGVAATCDAEGVHEPAKDAGRMEATLRDAFAKLGETDFALRALQVVNPAGLFVPVSRLNALRRELTDRLAEACAAGSLRCHAQARACATELPPAEPLPATEHWTVQTDQPECLARIADADEVALDLAAIPDDGVARVADAFGTERIRLVLPGIVRGWESAALRRRIDGFLDQGFRRWTLTHAAGWEFLPGGLDLAVDWTLPTFNAQAATAWLELGASTATLSPEDTRENLAALLPDWGGRVAVVLYQDTPLMVSEACPVTALQGGCGGCRGDGVPASTPGGSQSLRPWTHGAPPSHGNTSGTAFTRGGSQSPATAAQPLSPSQGPLSRTLTPVRGGDDVWVRMRGCRATVFNEKPFSLTGQLAELRKLGARRWRVDFALRNYTPDEAHAIWQAAREGRRLPATHTGNWNRGEF